MKQVKAGFPIFFILLLVSLLIFLFFQSPLVTGLQLVTLPIQKLIFFASQSSNFSNSSTEQLQQENNQLQIQLAKMQEVERDNQALHDQFQTTNPAPQQLLPADVVGVQQNALIIDKGEQDNLHSGEAVVIKNNFIGMVSKTTPHVSQVTLLNDPTTSFTAQSVKTGANGIVKSKDGGIVTFDNVVLSDKLEKNDIVVTKGDLNAQGKGYPPQLVVGKIISIDKQASSLFQSAKIESLVNVSDLRIVFVITQ